MLHNAQADDRLVVATTANQASLLCFIRFFADKHVLQDPLSTLGLVPVLGIDVWEVSRPALEIFNIFSHLFISHRSMHTICSTRTSAQRT